MRIGHKKLAKDESVPDDEDGTATTEHLTAARSMVWRICSTHPSSLGMHPALYFYSPNGVFQPAALLSFVMIFKTWDTPEFVKFTSIRSKFEDFLLAHRGITEAVRRLGSGARSRPRITAFYRTILDYLHDGKTAAEVHLLLRKNTEFDFMFADMGDDDLKTSAGRFGRDVKGAAFLRDALPSAPKCPTCGGILHRNGMHVGHKEHKRDGGPGILANAQMQHPFCNSTMNN